MEGRPQEQEWGQEWVRNVAEGGPWGRCRGGEEVQGGPQDDLRQCRGAQEC